MKNYNIIIFLFILLTSPLLGQFVPLEQARKVASQFLVSKHISNWNLEPISGLKNTKDGSTPLIYVFENKSAAGFILVASDLRIHPILGYSTESGFEVDSLPPDLARLIELYETEIRFVQASISPEKSNQSRYWESIENGSLAFSKATVSPLLTTNWSQRPNYNAKTPVPSGANSTPVGCVATAMAQIMKFHNFPAYGCGTKSYTTYNYGTLAANFGSTNYEWSLMPNALNSSSPNDQINAVAQLMYHAGIAVSMNYTPTGSSASVSAFPPAFVNYFNYSSGISQKSRSSYTSQQWNEFVINDLIAGKPVLHTGYCPNPAAGHAFVIDGCDELSNFHVNWGWGGSHNGYFQLSNLNPGSYAFNQSQTVIVNIQPISNLNQLTLAGSMNTPSSVVQSTPFSFMIPIKNNNISSFSGKVKVELMDLEGNSVSTIYTSNTINLASGAQTTLNVSNKQIVAYPGNFKVVVYSSVGASNKWIQLLKGSYTNPKSIKIKEILHPIKVSNNPQNTSQYLMRNTSTSFTMSVKNTNSSSISGSLRAVILNTQGDFVSALVTNNSFNLPAGGSTLFSIQSGFNFPKGTYYVVLQYKPFGGVYQTIGGITSAISPLIKLIIKEAAPSNLSPLNEPVVGDFVHYNQSYVTTFSSANLNHYLFIPEETGWYKLSAYDKFSEYNWDGSLTNIVTVLYDENQKIVSCSDKNSSYWLEEGKNYHLAICKSTLLDEAMYFGFSLQALRDETIGTMLELEEKVVVYPTIFIDQLNLVVDDESTVEEINVYNQMGQLVGNYDLETFRSTTDFGHLPKGSFSVQVVLNGATILRKVIKV